MDDTPETVTGISEYYGQIYYFCSPTCKGSFDKEPEKYLGTERDIKIKLPIQMAYENRPFCLYRIGTQIRKDDDEPSVLRPVSFVGS
jgi:YHS domain-containing protein